jgi:tRNA threonylcarbamoyladenosine biosynthesis protein TsaE
MSTITDHQTPAGCSLETLLEFMTHSPEETQALGSSLVHLLQPPCVVLLRGELGSGKTTLAKGIVVGLGAAREEDVTSPSFTLVHEYRQGDHCVYHADLYRVEGSREIETLGLEDLMAARATVLIEWGDKLGPELPVPRIEIELTHLGGDERRIVVRRAMPAAGTERR